MCKLKIFKISAAYNHEHSYIFLDLLMLQGLCGWLEPHEPSYTGTQAERSDPIYNLFLCLEGETHTEYYNPQKAFAQNW